MEDARHMPCESHGFKLWDLLLSLQLLLNTGIVLPGRKGPADKNCPCNYQPSSVSEFDSDMAPQILL